MFAMRCTGVLALKFFEVVRSSPLSAALIYELVLINPSFGAVNQAMAGVLEIHLKQREGKIPNFSRLQFEKVSDNFKLMDRDKDGRLSADEVGRLFRAFGQNPTDKELARLLEIVPPKGLDEAGFVDFFLMNYKTPMEEDTLIKAFKTFDLDKTGLIHVDKFKTVLNSMGEPLPEEMLKQLVKEIAEHVEVDPDGFFEYVPVAQMLKEGPRKVREA
eukprot:TRINITY_DN101047_c0_g1_i1.p1 TRINITY_DN101047_c0_g1~~TRINITY_DN101047_c0_g1_i1.p1  ORF type:complete len:216 (-),score=53.96 TRINITY_DN101047_c0_g1_i1:134-781(-)